MIKDNGTVSEQIQDQLHAQGIDATVRYIAGGFRTEKYNYPLSHKITFNTKEDMQLYKILQFPQDVVMVVKDGR